LSATDRRASTFDLDAKLVFSVQETCRRPCALPPNAAQPLPEFPRERNLPTGNAPMQTRPTLLFDVMDTLVYNPFNREIPEYFGLSQSELLAQKHPTAWLRFETGQIEEAEYLRYYFNDEREFDHQEFLRVVQSAYQWVDGAEQLLQRLSRAGLEIHTLSNYPVWFRTIEAKLQLSRYLKWTFVSCLTGVRKPAPAAYFGAAGRLNRSVGACLLIDDSVANCESAEAIGMPAIRFCDSASVWESLRQRGLVG
jgi:HAD superfamily hydrolase (TIGR01509 family)